MFSLCPGAYRDTAHATQAVRDLCFEVKNYVIKRHSPISVSCVLEHEYLIKKTCFIASYIGSMLTLQSKPLPASQRERGDRGRPAIMYVLAGMVNWKCLLQKSLDFLTYFCELSGPGNAIIC